VDDATLPVLRGPGAGDLFQLLRDRQARTRADLALLTGQARSTVASRVDQLMASGLIVPVGEASSTGGRPALRFAFNPAARKLLAIDLGATHARLAVTDLDATVLAEREGSIDIVDGPDVVLPYLVELAQQLTHSLDAPPGDLVAAGIGLPAPVEQATGRPMMPPIMPGWDGVDVAGPLCEALGVPVVVDNDVNLMALGEHTRAWPETSHLLFVKVATGIGSGIISAGQLSRGAQGAAGDIGHIAVPGSQTPCHCGNIGCLEVNASGRALARRLSALGYPAHDSADVVALVRGGNLEANQVVRQAGREIGGVLAACVSLLNPSLIVIGGALSLAGEHLVAGIREAVYSRSLPLAAQHLRIATSRTGSQAGIFGASALAAAQVLSVEAVDRLIRAG